METISHIEIRRMLIGGYLRVLSQKDQINKINLFPVPDQDTGSNLVRTLKGVYSVLEHVSFSDMASLRYEVLEGALTMAAGNAGIITTSFLGGFLETLTDDATPTILIRAFAEGYTKAYESVQNPKSGTILDVMRATSESISALHDTSSIKVVLEAALKASQEALKTTESQMDVYRKSSVVDAGGLGFTLLLEGFVKGYSNVSLHVPTVSHSNTNSKVLIEITEQRFEVVSLLESLKTDRETILSKLIPCGDCIDIVEVNDKMKIHIHTDQPNTVVDMISEFGSVVHMKTVDMNVGESEMSDDKKSSIGLVTDEGAALSLAYATANDIAVVPFQITWDEVSKDSDLEGMNFYEKMRHLRRNASAVSLPKTSQPSAYAFIKAFKDQLQKYDHVVCIVTSSAVSGTFNSALHARNQLSSDQKDRVHIPDVQQALAGQTLLVHAAVDHIQKQYDIHTLLRHLAKRAKEIDVFGFGHDAYWVVKGGRLGANKGKILTAIHDIGIQPIVGLKKGKLGLKSFAKRRSSIADMAYRYMMQKYGDAPGTYSVVIHHSDCPAEVTKVRDKLANTQFTIVDEAVLSPIVGVHTGPDAM
ncbi:DegV family EDD domain-containing protein, partial [Candidatus Woesebacteria bacterium]|nr:DegV family EDD domain-containing protein [Candidatus Woesebacteria bacterium]